MSNEATPVNKTPLKVVTLDEVLEAERDKIVGNGNPDGYLLPYAKPTLDKHLHRDKAVEINRPDRLS
ncbi:MAG: hypothetical protein AAB800_04545 [Patescibacteria group bacterium]